MTEQTQTDAGSTIDAPALEPDAIVREATNTFRDHFETVAEQHGTEAAWEAVRRLAEICTDPDNITP